MNTGNKNLEIQIVNLLEQIVSNSSLHSRFLNTLSFLEYIGTRKIIKSQASDYFNEELLEHLNEEARHSLFFKKLAQKLSNKAMGFRPEDLLLKKDSESYFQNLDKKSKELSPNPFINYLYTTWSIENRAIYLYSIYDKILKKHSFSFSLRFILKEEGEHLKYVEDLGVNKNPKDKKLLKEFEEKEFSYLMSKWHEFIFSHKEQTTSPDL